MIHRPPARRLHGGGAPRPRSWPVRFLLLLLFLLVPTPGDLALAAPVAAAPAPPADGTLVYEWNALMLAALRHEAVPVTLATRHLALLHIAIHDAIQSVIPTHQPYLGRLTVDAGASVEAAAITAAWQTMLLIHPASRAQADALRDAQIEALDVASGRTAGEDLGQRVAQAVAESRGQDGSTTQVPYIPDTQPGAWRRTDPFFRPPLDPHWRHVDLFGLPDKEPFVAPPPPALDSPAYATVLEEVRSLGAANSTLRTPEQTEIARFWSDFAYTATPPGHWYEIATAIAASRGLDLPGAARLFALLGIAHADAAIVCWEGKYRYNLWRPITAIREAAEDGNPWTAGDPTWTSLLVSPHFPEHPSGHSTFSKASAELMVRFFGAHDLPFTVSSDTLPGVNRSFHGPADCADEVGRSRIYGGIHFESANRAGKESGRRIAAFIESNLLLPDDALPLIRIERSPADHPRLRTHARWDTTAVVEASEDLRTWQPIATNAYTRGGTLLADPPSTPGHARFFRVRTASFSR